MELRHPYAMTAQDVAEALQSDLETGLSAPEARRRLELYGPNELQETPPPSLLEMLWEQFNNFVVIMLIVAAIVSAVVGAYTGEGYTDALAIVAIVVLNAILGVVQEGRAEAALRALKKMSAPEAHVIREGKAMTIPNAEVVPGDVVLLETGNYVPADARLFSGFNLAIDESSLTGESVSVEKDPDAVLDEDVPLGDRKNMAYMGSVVTYGHGRGIVVATGMNTEIGQIAEMLQSYEEPPTPLQRRLDQLGRVLGWATLVVCGIVFAVGVVRLIAIDPVGTVAGWLQVHQHKLIELFMVAVSLAIAAVPEGLPAVVTIALALGMQRMIRRNALIRKLPAVETLGSATVICSDKTGTLTTNEMTVVRVWVDGKLIRVTGRGYKPEGEFVNGNDKPLDVESMPDLRVLGTAVALCNDALLQSEPGQDGGEIWKVVGDPTEGALISLAAKMGISSDEIGKAYPRVAEIAFDSDRKRMTTIHKISSDGLLPVETPYVAFTKGAPEMVLGVSSHILRDGKIEPLTDADREAITQLNADLAAQALRVLAAAFKPMDGVPDHPTVDEVEHDLVFIGLIAMRDPARPEVKEAIKVAKGAGIRTVMITGDYPATAAAIARELGLMDNGAVVAGTALDAMSDEELVEIADQVNVYARVSPAHKVRIVDALKARGYVVAMTGDGVNDAPALKRAHIGVAMGITGTDVSKQTADMVLTDDNYASIVAAVEEGRVIYSNIRKFVFYLISCNVGEILIIFLAMMMGLPLPLLPIHLLWLNLVTDGAPALALGMEEKEPDIMRRPPRPSNEPILTSELWVLTAIQAVVETAATLGAFMLSLTSLGDDLTTAQTVAFTTLVVAELLRAYTARSERYNVWQIGLFSNKWMVAATATSFLLLLAVVYLPFLQPVFNTSPLTWRHWSMILPMTLLPAIAAEAAKYFLRRRDGV